VEKIRGGIGVQGGFLTERERLTRYTCLEGLALSKLEVLVYRFIRPPKLLKYRLQLSD